jgi:hypothetical protein
MKFLLPVLAFILFNLQGFSQVANNKGMDFYDGWALTKKGDTLKGKICYENSKTGEVYEKIFFMDATNQKKRMGGEKLTKFSCNNRNFGFITPLEDDPMPLLVEILIDGDMNLYKYWFKMPESSPQKFVYETGLFIKKKNENGYFEVLEKGFKKTMKEVFNQDTQIIEMIKEKNWTAKDIDKIVIAYNSLE